jgi:hypothetical protein
MVSFPNGIGDIPPKGRGMDERIYQNAVREIIRSKPLS